MSINYQKDNSFAVLQQFDKDIALEIENDSIKAVNNIAKIGLFSFQSVVPIRTGLLRNRHIQIDFANKLKPRARIYVVDQEHSRNLSSSNLANILNIERKFKRSRDSMIAQGFSSIPAGSPTADWIDIGYANFLSRVL